MRCRTCRREITTGRLRIERGAVDSTGRRFTADRDYCSHRCLEADVATEGGHAS